jgi:hypothetical protein
MGGKAAKTKPGPLEVATANQLTGTLFPAANKAFAQGTSGIYQGTRLADQDPLIRQNEDYMLNTLAPGMQGTADANMNNVTSFFNPNVQGLDELFTSNNAAENARSQAQLQGLFEQLGIQSGRSFNRNILPGLNDQAAAAGQFSSSKAGIAQGVAAADMQDNMNYQIAGLLQQDLTRQDALRESGLNRALTQREADLNRALTASGLYGDAQRSQLVPSTIREGIGMNRSARAQAELDDVIQQFNAPRDANWQNLKDYASIIAVGQGGPNTVTSQPGKGSPAVGGLSGAIAGGVAGAAYGTIGGYPGAAVGAVAGGVLGVLGTM